MVGEEGQLSREAELAVLEGMPEASDELAAKFFTQHLLGQEVVVAGANPTGVIGRETAGGHDTMDMRMSAPTPTVP